ncbi:lipoprotein [Klebsiella michiganensis]|nr:lipoprotein [Klebsiella michiganensis]
MKKRLLLLLAVGALSACDEKGAPQAFTPEMASFSNEFEFDPLRGPVKAFSQTLYDEHDQVVKWVKGRLSSEGCFDLLAFEDRENKTGAALVLDANYYLDAQSHEKRLRLQGKCQLAEMPSRGSPGKPMITGLSSPLAARRVQRRTATIEKAIRWAKPP